MLPTPPPNVPPPRRVLHRTLMFQFCFMDSLVPLFYLFADAQSII